MAVSMSLVGVALAGLLLASAPLAAAGGLEYPRTRRVNQVDVYHGVEVPDPYRWLEDDVRNSRETARWVEAQNQVTFGYLKSIPARQEIFQRLKTLWDCPRFSAPLKRGGRYYYLKNDGLENQSVLYRMDSLDGEPRVLIDPNKWSPDGTAALGGLAFSDDGKYLAYTRSEAGSDWNTGHVMEIESGAVLSDELRWLKWSGASWTKDGKGFFYSRYEEPREGQAFQSLNVNHKVYYHRVGAPQSDDEVVYHRPEHPEWNYHAEVTEDGRYLVIAASVGTDDRFRVTIKDLADPYAMPVELIENFEHEYSLVGNDGPLLYFKTDRDAPRRRLIGIDLRRPQPEYHPEIIPQADETLLDVSLVGNQFIASYLKDVKPRVRIHAMDGRFLREVEFPGIGSVGGFDGRRTDTETFYTFTSYTTPPVIYRYDMLTSESRLFRRAEVDFNADEYEVKQVFYASRDGTRIPMFLAHKKGIKLDGSNPTLLSGYGGFNISLRPGFSVSRLAWMERGGILAVPNLRGGGEYGEAWHKAGTKLNKQNVFDDFIAAAEWLIEQKYTRPDRLGIQGGSNGGLLVGAVMTQRPELFGACLAAVGVMDMLRFHKFTAGRYWVDDYGSSDNPEEFRAILKYSPYHNLKPGTRYPATLVTTADTDDRVVPGHSFKFAAALQHSQAGDAPVLIRIETRAGHGSGKPVTKVIEEAADELAFLVRNLGM